MLVSGDPLEITATVEAQERLLDAATRPQRATALADWARAEHNLAARERRLAPDYLAHAEGISVSSRLLAALAEAETLPMDSDTAATVLPPEVTEPAAAAALARFSRADTRTEYAEALAELHAAVLSDLDTETAGSLEAATTHYREQITHL